MLISNSYDQAGRISQVFGSWNSNSTTYASLPTVFGTSYAYASHGAIQQMALGPILTEQTCYNTRLQAIDHSPKERDYSVLRGYEQQRRAQSRVRIRRLQQ